MSQKAAVVYARVSDRKQAEKDISIPAQIDLAHKRAAELGAAVLRVFTDSGKSAFKEGNRPEFEAAVDFATSVGAEYFICWSSSRFARNRFEAAVFKRSLDRAGVRLVYLSSDIDRSTDEGWMLDSMLELVDEMYSRQNSKDTLRSMVRGAREGYWNGGSTPLGYRSEPAPENPKRRRLVPDEAEAAMVQSIFAQRVRGVGTYQIAVGLNAQGLRIRGRPWTKQRILYLLRSEVVIGHITFGKIDRRTKAERPRAEWVVVASHPPIIDRELFDEVQRLMQEAAEPSAHGSARSGHLFTGILRCGECGTSLQVETGKGKMGKLYSYYSCQRSQKGYGCKRRRIPAAPFDQWMNAIILDRVLSPRAVEQLAAEIEREVGSWAREQQAQQKALQVQITGLRSRNAKLFDLLELHGRDAPNLGDLTGRLRANNEEIKALEAQHSALLAAEREAGAAPDAGMLSDLADFVRGLLTDPENAKRVRALYSTFIERIVIGESEATIEYTPAKMVAAPPVERVRSNERWWAVPPSLRTRSERATIPDRLFARNRGRAGRHSTAAGIEAA
jgi:site-specific DNA recombinase